jgi:hypothetical protein
MGNYPLFCNLGIIKLIFKEKKPITKAIRNVGNMLILRFLGLIKISSSLKINHFKPSHYA